MKTKMIQARIQTCGQSRRVGGVVDRAELNMFTNTFFCHINVVEFFEISPAELSRADLIFVTILTNQVCGEKSFIYRIYAK